MEIILVK